MATKKSATSTRTKKSTTTARKKPATKTTKVTRVSASSAKTPSRSVATATGTTTARRLDSNVLNIVIAELLGTFVLTIVALLSMQNIVPLYVGLTLVLLVMTIGAVSGSHVNPAVTFGLWSVNRLKTVLVPFYWAAQLLGAMAALVVVNVTAGNKLGLDFGHFNNWSWSIFSVEMVGTAVFLFGLVAVVSRLDLTAGSKAVGIGLSLMAGLLVATTMYGAVQANVDSTKVGVETDQASGVQRLTNVPHELRVSGATLNPAIALATTENTDSQLQNSASRDDEAQYTRLGWEVLLSTLLGAAVGGNLARLINYRFNV